MDIHNFHKRSNLIYPTHSGLENFEWVEFIIRKILEVRLDTIIWSNLTQIYQ